MTLPAEPFLRRYEGLRARLPGPAAAREDAARALRAQAGERAEAWKYTDLRPLAALNFHEALTAAGDDLAPIPLPHLGALGDCARLVFFNGRLRSDLSIMPGQVQASHFAGHTGPAATGPIATLNALLAEDGATLRVEPGVDAGVLLLISIGRDLAGRIVAFHPRHDITLGENAALTLVEIATGQGAYLHNPVARIELSRGARLTHVRLQQESPDAYYLGEVRARIAEAASYDSFTLTTGAALSRAEIHAELAGPQGHAALNAAQLLGGTQHADFTTVVSHAAPHCASRQTVKNVLAGKSRGVFQGKIEVARAAQKTDGYQMNQALLLSPDAEIDSKPQLEIYADDVKCSHGATVGELDGDQLFYLTSRGIPAAEARQMLVHAFLADALDLITHDGARALLEASLP